MGRAVQGEYHMGVSFQGRAGWDEPQLTCHTKMNNQKQLVFELDEDVLSAPPDTRDPHARHRVDELLRLRMTDDAREIQLAPHDGASRKVRPQIGDDGLDFRKLRH